MSNYDIVVKGADGKFIIVNVGSFITPGSWQKKVDTIAFLVLRRVDCYPFIKRLSREFDFELSPCKPSAYNLTGREREVLELASKGMSTSMIAKNLGISTATVRNHFKNIFAKLNVHSRAEATSLALRSGLI